MSTTDQPHARLTSRGELLAAIPYLLGFHPHDSLVLVGVNGGVLVVTARVDLSGADEHARYLHDTVAAIVRGGANEIIGAIYPAAGRPTDDRSPHRRLIDHLTTAARSNRALLTDVLLVVDGRWRSCTCDEGACCPAGGVPVPGTFAAAATYAGVAIADTRAAMEQQLEPRPDRDTLIEQLDQAETSTAVAARMGWLPSHERSAMRAIFAAARACAIPVDNVYPNDSDAARYGAALTRIAVRDPVWMAVDDGRLAGGALWLDLARRLPPPYDAPPLFLYGWHAWRTGNGALASMAAERAVASDPHYSAAVLLIAALAQGINPHTFPRLRLPTSGNREQQRTAD